MTMPFAEQDLTLLLTKTLDTVTALQRALEQESDILLSANADALPANSEHKEQLVQQLQQLEQSRTQLMLEAGLDSHPALMFEQLQQHGVDESNLTRWQQIQSTVQESQSINQKNGELIQQRSQQLNQAIHYIFTPPEKNLYSGERVGKPTSSGTLLGSA